MSASPWGRDEAWWARHPIRSIPASRVEVADTPVSSEHVELYRAQPWLGEVPCVAETADGRFLVLDGKHHALAALAEDRELDAHVAPEPPGCRPRNAEHHPVASDPAAGWFG